VTLRSRLTRKGLRRRAGELGVLRDKDEYVLYMTPSGEDVRFEIKPQVMTSGR
jgi:hypothetical protein